MIAKRMSRIIAAAIVALLLNTGLARADGDPASDVLIGQSVFYPYPPSVSPALQTTLHTETAAASRSHFPIKVALIGSPADLGTISSLFGQPQKYADFLEQEISYLNVKPLLLVVMANGYGVGGLSSSATVAAAALQKPAGGQSNDLARAAITAVAKLASASGHQLGSLRNGSAAGSGSGWTPLAAVLLALAAVTAAGVILVLRQRRAARIIRSIVQHRRHRRHRP